MSDGSDMELLTNLPNKTKKPPKSNKSAPEVITQGTQDQKKISTKVMIHEALNELKNRKGTSLYAIKKYITEKYNVDTEKLGYIIKKLIKTGVETGTIIQTKGIGASGSFKLAIVKKAEKKPKKKKTVPKNKSDKENPEEKPKTKKKSMETNKEEKKKVATVKKTETTKKATSKEVKQTKTQKKPESKMAKEMKTPAKKRAAMMKRKSIGSIIKPPKMNPKSKK
ncbi:histone H1-like [Achroia grisella]|uniref:histone H1-like n=1 Tax=Achroia grisella TaxID=688607 RepID=UPI0027D21736|nr:histone H1-like [Achroia grisella]